MTPCILAKQKPRKDGYVLVCWRESKKALYDYAHRISYRDSKGEIPKGLVIDHLCRVRNCINPDHLEAVTNGENLKRKLGKNMYKCPHKEPRVNSKGYCQDCQNGYHRKYLLKVRKGIFV